ncbi:MAG: LUD domain-containing protein [Bacillota bacterium]
MKQTLERMRKQGFEVVELDTARQAKEYLLANIPSSASVGVAGTVSVRETGVLPALIEKGCVVYSHWDVKPEDAPATRQKAHRADVYLTSANALSKHGGLVLIDGTGNRVAAVAHGPGQVYFVVSHSKWVDGGYGAAVARIKKVACPLNARRLRLHTPCGNTGVCDPGACGEDCMCRETLVLDRVPRGRKMTMLFIREKLGY